MKSNSLRKDEDRKTDQGFPVSSKTDTIDLGPLQAAVRPEKHLPVPPIVSIAAVGAGLTLVVLGRK